jgi:hypothetical protein
MDNEINGTGNMINYKYRVHDVRIGRFLSIDPLTKKYPHNSPYAFSENRVIDGVELEGLEWVLTIFSPSISKSFKKAYDAGDIYEQRRLTYWALNNKFEGKDLDWVKRRGGPLFKNENPDYFGAKLSYNPDIEGVSVRFYNYEGGQIGKEHPDPQYHVAPAGGKVPELLYPVDVNLYCGEGKQATGDFFYGEFDFIGTEYGTEYVAVLADEDWGPASKLSGGRGLLVGRMRGFGYVKYSYEVVAGAGLSFEFAHKFDVRGKYIGTDREYGSASLAGKGLSWSTGFIGAYGTWRSYNSRDKKVWKGDTKGVSAGFAIPSIGGDTETRARLLPLPKKTD